MEVEDEGLLDYAMKGQLREAVEGYKKNPKALEARTPKSEDTVMHIAIYVGQTNFVTSLLDEIEKDDERIRILSMQNSKGNTPLHLAAELGNLEICRNIAGRDSNLILCRNLEGETPLFLAAHYGKKDAFFRLHGYINKGDCSLCRRTNGDTILHSTIYGEFFDLAFQIIHLYPHLALSRNEEGVSPLHILAMKPNCFKSSTRMETFDNLIYHCKMFLLP